LVSLFEFLSRIRFGTEEVLNVPGHRFEVGHRVSLRV
jgi:hypothetical protein